MQFLVLAWLVLEVTGSKTQLGVVLFFYGVPNVSLLVVGGVIADRFDRKRLLMAIQATVGGLIAALAALYGAGLVQIWHIYAVGAALGVLQALNQPARVTLLSDLVEEEALLDAVASFNLAVHLGRIGGPPVMGLVIDTFGIAASLYLNASLYALSILCLSRLRPMKRRNAGSRDPLLRNFVEGFVEIRQAPVLLTVIVLACSFGGFGMSHLQVIPAFAREQLGSGASEAGLLLLGFRHRVGHREPVPQLHGTGLAVPVADGLPGLVLLRTDNVRLDALVLGRMGAVPGCRRSQPGYSMALGDHHPADERSGRGPGKSNGSASLHPGLPLPGSAAAGGRRGMGGLAGGDQHRSRGLPAGHPLVRRGD